MAANTWSSAGSTDWDTDANWSLGHKPAAGETATFDATSVISCTLATDVTGIAMAIGTGYTGTLNLNGKAVTGGDDLDFTWNIGTGGTINMAASVVTCDGNFDWSGAAGTITRGTSTLVMTGVGKTLNAPLSNSPQRYLNKLTIETGSSVTTGSGSIACYGLVTVNGTIALSANGIYCDAGFTQGASGSVSGGLLRWWAGTVTLSNAATITPSTLLVNQRTATIPSATYSPTTLFWLAGSSAMDNTFTWPAGITTFTSPVQIDKTTANTFTVSGANNPTLVFQANVTISVTAGTLIFANNSTNPNQLTGTANQTVNLAGKNMGAWVNNKPASGAVTWTPGDTITAGGAWTSAAAITQPAGVTIDLGDGAYTHSFGDLTLSGTAFDAGNSAVSLTGSLNFSGVGTWTPATASWTFNGTGAQTYTPKTGAALGGLLTVNKSAGTFTQAGVLSGTALSFLDGDWNPAGYAVTMTGAVSIAAGVTITAAGLAGATWTVGGSFTATGASGTYLTLNPASAWNLNISGTATISYATLANCNASGGSEVSAVACYNAGTNTNVAFADTYYVANAGSDSAAGTSKGAPWQTVAHVNGLSLNPGDRIEFFDDDEWREMLVVSSSGTEGNEITFTRTGDGTNRPIFNGSALLDTSGYAETIPYDGGTGVSNIADGAIRNNTELIPADEISIGATSIKLTFEAASVAVSASPYTASAGTSDQADGVTRNYTELIPGNEVLVPVSTVKLTLQAASGGGPWVIVGVGIGPQASGSNASSITRVTFDGGNAGCSIAQGQSKTSDEITFTMTPGTAYLVRVYMTSRYLRTTGTGANTLWYNSTAVDGSQDLTGPTTSGTISMVRSITSTTGWIIAGCGIGEQDSGSNALSITRVTFDGGANGCTIAPGESKTSDAITFTIERGKNYLVRVYMLARCLRTSGGGVANTLWYNSTAVDGSQDLTGPSSTGTIGMVRKIEPAVGTAIYDGAQATDPVILWEDGVYLSEEDSPEDCTTAGTWYWDGASLYLHAADDSDVATNGKVYEIKSSITTLVSIAQAWVTLDGIDCLRVNGKAISITAEGVTVKNLTAGQTQSNVIYLGAGAIACTVEDCILFDAYPSQVVTCTSATCHDNTIRRNTIYQTYGVVSSPVGVYLTIDTYNNLIEQNDIEHVTSCTAGGMVMTASGAHDNTIRFNYLHGTNDYGVHFLAGSDTVFHDNVIDGQFTIVVRVYGHDGLEAIHNTIYVPLSEEGYLEGFAFKVYNAAANTTIKNNIIWYGATYLEVQDDSLEGFVSDHNCFYGSFLESPFAYKTRA